MPPRKYLDYDKVKRARTGGKDGLVKLTYAQLAEKFRVSESAVYYACNPRVRRRRQTAIGRPRQVYAGDPAWEQLRERAKLADTSISRVVDAILHGEDPPLQRAVPVSSPQSEGAEQEEAAA